MYLEAIVSLDWILGDVVTCRQVNFPVQISRLQRERKCLHLDKQISTLALCSWAYTLMSEDSAYPCCMEVSMPHPHPATHGPCQWFCNLMLGLSFILKN